MVEIFCNSILFGQGAVGLVLETEEKMESFRGYDNSEGGNFRGKIWSEGGKLQAGGFILAVVLLCRWCNNWLCSAQPELLLLIYYYYT